MANTQNLDLVKPLGTDYALVSVLNSNSDKIDAYAGAVNASLDGLRDGLGILANGNTHAAITSGQYVYVKNHGSLPEGLYKATANIAANGTLSTSNLAADSAGGLNSLNEQIGNKADKAYKNLNWELSHTFTLNQPCAGIVIAYNVSYLGLLMRYYDGVLALNAVKGVSPSVSRNGNTYTLTFSDQTDCCVITI